MKTLGESEERRIEERLHSLEMVTAAVESEATNLNKTMVAGFSSTHDRLDRANGDFLKLAEKVQTLDTWKTVHDAMETGRGQAWGSMKTWLFIGFGALAGLEILIGFIGK